jgi:Leucine-rich repeat (LRR) protein
MSREASRRAEEKIEAARQSGAKELDLGEVWAASEDKSNPTDLLESICQLTQLELLDLSRNQLTTLPESIGHLTQLSRLIAQRNQLASLPESIGQLRNLNHLVVFRNQLTWLPEWIGQLTELESLDISYNELRSLPESLSKLTQLKRLHLTGNKLTSLPEWIGRLKQLDWLSLSGNKLTSLPESIGQLTQLPSLNLSGNKLTSLPESIGQLRQLQSLDLSSNQLTSLPKSIGQLKQLSGLNLSGNQLTTLPDSFRELKIHDLLELFGNRFRLLPNLPDAKVILFGASGKGNGNPLKELPPRIRSLERLTTLTAWQCELSSLPDWLGEVATLESINLSHNQLSDLPPSLLRLKNWNSLQIEDNPLSPELAAASKEGLDAVKRYLGAKAEAQVVLNEAKLILIGEGEVGKTCLLGALRSDPWEENRRSTHGIEIKPVKVTDPATGTEITLNGWDFGGQPVYRPTHQLFFSAPAVYLVVWKPREGPQQGFVREWIKLVKHREPDAKTLVVATHGGPGARQPDIDRQELWDVFGKEAVVDFLHIDSKPDPAGKYVGIEELKRKVAEVATSLPEVGRKVPKSWHDARVALKNLGRAYITIQNALEICAQHKMSEEDTRLFLTIEHRLGHVIYYAHDPLLRDIVVLKPDWLATAISYVLDDKETREVRHGLVSYERLGLLWNDAERPAEFRYDSKLHPLFVRLMERFDLSYKVAVPQGLEDGIGFLQRMRNPVTTGSKTPAKKESYTSLIAQLVPDVRPMNELAREWPDSPAAGDEQQVQICRIVETANNQSANAEGLFYQLIVRLHKYSLGRADFRRSVQWQRGLVLSDETGARALLEHTGNDVRIIVRSPYPTRFLGALTLEVQYLVQSFWTGLRCDVTVPCLATLPGGEKCKGLFEVGKLLENKKRGRLEVPCPLCNEWQSVEQLLGNAPAARPNPLEELLKNQRGIVQKLNIIYAQQNTHQAQVLDGFVHFDASIKGLVAKVEEAYTGLMRTLLDEAREGPRLFSLQPIDAGFLDRPTWIAQKFRLTLWCEHSRVPLPFLNRGDTKSGVYEFEIPREWFVKAAPVLKTLASIASLMLPVASALLKMELNDAAYKTMEKQLDFGQKCAESVLKNGEEALKDVEGLDDPELPTNKGITARGAVLRQLQAWLKEKDPGFGGLVRVQNRRQEFLWVHPQFQFEKEYLSA